MNSDGFISHPGLINLLLCVLSNGLLLLDLVGEDLGGGENLDGRLILENVTLG